MKKKSSIAAANFLFFILPALFPGINARAGKKFDDYQKMYDEADDASFNNKGTVSAASPGGTRFIDGHVC